MDSENTTLLSRSGGWLPRSVLMRGVLVVIVLQLVVALLTRFALLFQARADAEWGISLLGAFVGGLGFDLLAALYAAAAWVLIAVLIPALLWRSKAGRVLAAVLLGIYSVVFVFISVSEWFFWDEFKVRFNFIAVDYLMFTQEVMDNINQSYPMPAILSGLALLGIAFAALAWRAGLIRWITDGDASWRPRLWQVPAFVLVLVGISYAFSQRQIPRFKNEYNRELAKNGIYSFCAAFWESEIDYERFYQKLPKEKALGRARQLLASSSAPLADPNNPEDLRRLIKREGPENKWNVVLISVESLSAEYCKRYKPSRKTDITPYFDKLCDEGHWLRYLYATGTRTVRGLEALTLSVPPTPGQSLVWRQGKNEGLFSLGSLFQERGYDTSYVYGGDSQFDFMRYFFSNNGYRVVGRESKTEKDWIFNNAWGVSDEDLFRWATEEADKNQAANKPFFMHVMTVSNHRPFTFPEGRIDMPSNSGRYAAVKYSDYAIGTFIENAKKKPWFANTLFVVVADHCAESAGKVELDVTKYQIPCVFYNPNLVKPGVFKGMCSQIDIAPTIAGLLNWSYTSRFFGQDVLSAGYPKEARRAFVSNYQKIALLTEDKLAILKPKGEFTVGTVVPRTGEFTPDTTGQFQPFVEDAVSYYQSAAWLLNNKHLGKDVSVP